MYKRQATNPVNGEQIPIWIADYVMMGYGTGAIMAVPAHDTRDFEFATKFNLPIVQVVQPPEGADWHGYVDDGIAVNSGKYDGLTTAERDALATRNSRRRYTYTERAKPAPNRLHPNES